VVTLHGYGTVTGDKDSAGNAEGEVKLAVDHRTLWVVEFDDIDMPVFGPVKSEGQASYEESDVVIFVDPETMKPFRAETLP
jgi:protein-tyrosine-phosphatase